MPNLYTKFLQTLEIFTMYFRNKILNFKTAEVAISSYTPISDSVLKKRVKDYLNSTEKKSVAVYTAIIDGYDGLKIPEFLNPSYDYICFSDRTIKGLHPWKIRYIDYFNFDSARIARFYKLHPHYYLKNYDITVWVDASILIRKDIGFLIDAFVAKKNPIGLFPHFRDCTYQEGKACIIREKDDASVIQSQIERYACHGLPHHLGLPETGILISRPRDPKAIEIFTLWWSELERGSKRDQLSIMYALMKKNSEFTRLVNSTAGIKEFNRNNLELFDHQKEINNIFVHTYRVPKFVKKEFRSKRRPWWEQEKDSHSGKIDLSGVCDKFVDIVIPATGELDEVKRCCDSIESTLQKNHRLVIVYDESETKTSKFLHRYAAKRNSAVKLIHCATSRGITDKINTGLKATDAEYVILLNSSTMTPKDWSLKLIHCAESAEEIGITAPLSNAADWQSIPRIKNDDGSSCINPLAKSHTIGDMDHLCEQYSPKLFPRVQVVNGFCFCVKWSVIGQIGYLNCGSYPNGYCHEKDFCFRTTDAGFVIAIATHTYVHNGYSADNRPINDNPRCEEFNKIFETYGINRVNRATESVRNNPIINKLRSDIEKVLTTNNN